MVIRQRTREKGKSKRSPLEKIPEAPEMQTALVDGQTKTRNFQLLVYAGNLSQGNWPILGLAAADLAFAPRGIIPRPKVELGRTEDFPGNEGTRWTFKNVVVSYCRIGRISQANRVDRIAEDFNYFPILGYNHDGLTFIGNDPYIFIWIQCDSVCTFKIGMRDKDVVETEGVGSEGSIATSLTFKIATAIECRLPDRSACLI